MPGITVQSNFEAITLDAPGNGLLLVTLDRPQAANAMNTRMGRELLGVLEDLSLSPGTTRCVVLTGRGDKAFCAGGDLKERRGMSDHEWQAQHLVFERLIRAMLGCPVPVIAAVNGAAYAGGCEMAAAADFVYAARHAHFALTEVTLGIMPGAGGTQTLARAVGERRAKELILTGLPFSAAEAYAWGLVNRVCEAAELLEATTDTARRIADNGPVAVRQAKQAISRGVQMSIWDGLAFEIEAYNRTVPTEDRREGVLAFNERRRPVFRGL
jgi:enoyl-CoA hydratase